MLTPSQQSQLQNLLAAADRPDQVLNLDELQGFLHGLAITPEIIRPSEWLPVVLGEQPWPSIENGQQEPFAPLLEACEHFRQWHDEGRLHFPFCLRQPSEETISSALDWAFGFNLALEMRPEIWFGNGACGTRMEREEKLFTSFSVVRAIAWPEEAEELFAEDGGGSQPKDECELLATLLFALPEAVALIEEYAAQLEDSPSRIGRNEPCPCGSGERYLHCCDNSCNTRH